jgi:hypothetical protein
MWAGSPEAVSKLDAMKKNRPEGPPVNRPGRQAGMALVDRMSAEGATLVAVPHLRRLFYRQSYSRPDGRAYLLTVLRT